MPTIKDVLKREQPGTYRKLLEFRHALKDKEGEKDEHELRKIEKLMGHDSYRRDRGGLRQVRQG